MEIIYINPKELKPVSYNPREISVEEFEKLKDSIKEFGMVESIAINKNNEIIGGHMRVRACIELGIDKVPCIRVDLSKHKEKLLNLALNKISGKWDNDKLGQLITELSGFDDIGLSGFQDFELNIFNQGPSLNSDTDTTEKDFEKYLSDTKDSFLLKVFTTKQVAVKILNILKENKISDQDDGQTLLRLIGNREPIENEKVI